MESTGGDDAKKGHLLVLPISHRGHLLPMLQFVTEVARRGVTITFVVYEDLLAGSSSEVISPELEDLDFRLVGLDNPWGHTNNIPTEDSRNLQESFKPVLDKLLQDKSTGIAGPTTIIADMFLSWAQDLSEKLELPLYVFIPSGAILAKFKQEYNWFFAQKQFRIDADGTLCKYSGAIDILGLPALRYDELVSTGRMYPASFLSRCKIMCQVAGIVLNTWYDLEGKVIESIKLGHPGFEESKVGRIYPVGPLLSASANLSSIAVGKGLEDCHDESLLWLNTQPPSSVLYVAFGTMAQLTAGQIHELALGLEASNTRFLWVLPQRKNSPSVKELLPQGFEARVWDRGHIVTGWAPQVQILAHSATWGFFTHAGWNSITESITRGVPMIAWPQWAEQALNTRYLMDDLKIAIQIQTGPENILDAKEVERAVRVLMVEPEGKEMKKRVQEHQRNAAEAVAEGGSRSKAIDKFAHDICYQDYPKRV